MTGVQLRHVTVRRGNHVAVEDLSLHVEPGSWWGVIGPNGAGKSSLLAAAAGVLPYDGEITLDGDISTALTLRQRASRVSYLPQTPVYPDQCSVADYVLLGRVPHAGYFGRSNSSDEQIVTGVLRRLELSELAHRSLGSLSGGERQRALLGRALAGQAGVLLADEPTTALDLGHQQRTFGLLDRLRRSDKLTVLTAMHDLTLAAQYADRLALLQAGKLIAVGAPEDVLTETRIAEVYGADVYVTTGSDGRPVITPRRL
ncbi:MAG: ABC transporter ATP-binding protein [Mycobacteriales bacterium]